MYKENTGLLKSTGTIIDPCAAILLVSMPRQWERIDNLLQFAALFLFTSSCDHRHCWTFILPFAYIMLISVVAEEDVLTLIPYVGAIVNISLLMLASAMVSPGSLCRQWLWRFQRGRPRLWTGWGSRFSPRLNLQAASPTTWGAKTH